MEFLLLLIPLGVLAAGLGGGGSGGSTDDEEAPPIDSEGLIAGTENAESISGGDGIDLIFGAAEDDTITGEGGRDLLFGEGQDDEISGAAGEDDISGGDGDDSLYGGADRDVIYGGAGDDLLRGGLATDLLFAQNGADTLFGGFGRDLLSSVDVRPGISPSEGRIIDIEEDIYATALREFGPDIRDYFPRITNELASSDTDAAADEAWGGEGEDLLRGDLGDTLNGGEGNDVFQVYHQTGDTPVSIADFDPFNESIRVRVEGEGPETLEVADGDDGAELRLDGVTVAVLAGISATDIDPASLRVERYLG